MKFIITFWLLCGTAMTIAQIPNASFDNWITHDNYEDPEGWLTFNRSTYLDSQFTAVKTTDAYRGNYALQLQTKKIINKIVPGFAETGNKTNSKNGYPFEERPTSLNGYYKYFPAGEDTFTIRVELYRFNGSIRQTIGTGKLSSDEMKTGFTNFSIPINYISSDTPDTITIHIVSSSATHPREGTTLIIDDLTFSGLTAIDGPLQPEITMYPNPVGDVLYIKAGMLKEGTIEIFNMGGARVFFGDFDNGGLQKFSLSHLSEGIYICRLTDTNGIQQLNKKLMIKR